MTPTDRELLERAAKVVGLKKDDSPYNGGGHGNTGYALNGDMVLDWHEGRYWNPLTNNADAFALMVRMGFSVEHMNGCVEIYGETHTHDYQMLAYEDYVAMPGNHEIAEAATRRAITRAAGATATASD